MSSRVRKSRWARPVVLWCVYFGILAALGIFIRDIQNQPALLSTIDDLRSGTWLGDPQYFLLAASDMASSGWISAENRWIFNLWPPGFSLLEAFVLKLFGFHAPILLILSGMSAALFAWVSTVLSGYLTALVGFRAAVLIPLTILVFPLARVFLLEPGGVALGESFATGLFLLGVLYLLNSVRENSLGNAALAGTAFALAAYFRSQFELLLLSMTVIGILWMAWQLISTKFRAKRRRSVYVERMAVANALIVTLLTGHMLTMPWRLYHWQQGSGMSWVQTSDLVFENSLRSTETLLAHGGGFLVAGGSNIACRVDPSVCDKSGKALVMHAFVNNVGAWYALKLPLVRDYWFAPVTSWDVASGHPSVLDSVSNTAFLIFLAGLLPLLVLSRSYPAWPILLWLNVAVLGAYFVIFTLVHFETRYFYFLKIYATFMFIVQISVFCRIRKEGNRFSR